MKTLGNFGVKPAMITSETHPHRVTSEIVNFLKYAKSVGTVLLITQQIYLALPYFHRRERWTKVIDELPQIDHFHKYNLPRNYHLISEHIEAREWVNEGMVLLQPKDNGKLERLMAQPPDDVFNIFRPLFKHLLSPYYQVFTETETWTKLKCNGYAQRDNSKQCIAFLSMLNSNPFEGAIQLGANVENSLNLAWLQRFHNRQFHDVPAISSNLRKLPCPGRRLKLRYFLENIRFSKSVRDKQSEVEGLSLIKAMDKHAAELFSGQRYLYFTNNDRTSTLMDKSGNAIGIPVVARGLNAYSDVHNIYCSAALNRETKHLQLLEKLGLSSEMVQAATAHETIYQGVLRTSLRNPTAEDSVTAVVPDKATALTIARLTGCEDVQRLCELIKEPPKALTGSQKRARRIARYNLETLSTQKMTPDFIIKKTGVNFGADLNHRDTQQTVLVTFHKTLYDNRREQFTERRLTVQEFIALFRQCSKAPIDKKDEFLLFHGASYNPPADAEGYRRKEYFTQSSFMALDFDNGKLSPEMFEIRF